MAPHTWSHLGDTVSDATHHMYYRGQRIKEAYYRGEKIWGEGDTGGLIISLRVRGDFNVKIKGENLSYSINDGKRIFTKSSIIRIAHSSEEYTVNYYATSATFFALNEHNPDWDVTPQNLLQILTPFGEVCSNIKDFSYCFADCESLTAIPSDLFFNTPKVTTFMTCFYQCYSIASIPSGLFDNTPNVELFDGCFQRCRSIVSMPSGLFSNNLKLRSASGCFDECALLTAIPSGLFSDKPQLFDVAGCFNGCKKITSIPSDLFSNTPNLRYMDTCFANCSKISSIPSNLFDDTPNIRGFRMCFYGCLGLTSIPTGLFDNIQNATDFSACFFYCYNLRGNAPELWNKYPSADGTRCFYMCSRLSNYSNIPSAWK